MTKNQRTVVLLLLDGWGIAPSHENNLISRARTPAFDGLVRSFPATALHNNKGMEQEDNYPPPPTPTIEDGYYSLGTGRKRKNKSAEINKAIKDGDLFRNKRLLEATRHVRTNNSKLHIIGMLSEADKHSSLGHLYALLELAKRNGVSGVYLHLILDGVEVRGDKGANYVEELQQYLTRNSMGEIATISGRFYAMDRDNHWNRTAKVYHAITGGEGRMSTSPVAALKESYNKQIYDKEFFPTVITTEEGDPKATVEEGDGIMLCNIRGDRFYQLVKAFTLPGLERIPGRKFVRDTYFVSLTPCGPDMPAQVAFPPQKPSNTLGDILETKEIEQLKLTFPEKYALTTYYFEGEQQPKRKHVKEDIIDTEEEISIHRMSERLKEAIKSKEYGFIICSFSEIDRMIEERSAKETIKAIESLDTSLEYISNEVLDEDGILVITSAIGGAEELYDPKMGANNTSFTAPFILVGKEWEGKTLTGGEVPGSDLNAISPQYAISSVAPSVLKVMNIVAPREMRGGAMF